MLAQSLGILRRQKPGNLLYQPRDRPSDIQKSDIALVDTALHGPQLALQHRRWHKMILPLRQTLSQYSSIALQIKKMAVICTAADLLTLLGN